jgi:hypothetical protein
VIDYFLAAAILISTSYSLYVYVTDERAHRAKWREAPPDISEDPPYRRVAEGGRTRAPALVRFAALACLWLGPVATFFMFIPAIYFSRGLRMMTTTGSGSLVQTALLVPRLGVMLLARDRQTVAAIDAVSPLLRLLALPLIGFSALSLLRDKGSAAFWWSLCALGVLFALLEWLLAATSRRFGEAFAAVAPITDVPSGS